MQPPPPSLRTGGPMVHRTHHWCYSAAAGSSLSHGQGASSTLPTAYLKREWNITPLQLGLQKTSPLCLNPPPASHQCTPAAAPAPTTPAEGTVPAQVSTDAGRPLPFSNSLRVSSLTASPGSSETHALTDIAAWRFHFENSQPSKQLAGYWLGTLACCLCFLPSSSWLRGTVNTLPSL